jgi:hypothetical protein
MAIAIPAHADPTDSPADASFVEAVKQAGISFKDAPSAVTAGKSVCEFLDQGKSTVDVVALVIQQNSGISNLNAAKFTAIAESAYCPQYLQRVSSSAAPTTTTPNNG